MDGKVQVILRVSPETKSLIRALAKKNNRSMVNMVTVTMLQEAERQGVTVPSKRRKSKAEPVADAEKIAA